MSTVNDLLSLFQVTVRNAELYLLSTMYQGVSKLYDA